VPAPVGGPAQESWFRAVDQLARATPWLHVPARVFAEYGVGLFAVLLLLAWWSSRGAGDPGRVAAALWAPVGVLVAHRSRALAWTAVALALLMAATRVYVGAHFPLDVVAGLLVGAVVALASYALVRPLVVRVVALVERTPARPLVRA
jgi:undecaprenyl-diphosphatase